jgi:hypothetical protein
MSGGSARLPQWPGSLSTCRSWRSGDSNSAPPPGVLPVQGPILSLTCGFSRPVVTAGARCTPLAAGGVCTQRVPLAPAPSRT